MKLSFLACMLSALGIMFWNLENYFDYFDGGYSASDREFSSMGAKHWTKARFNTKTGMIAKTILYAGSPEIIGVCEVENSLVLRRLCGCETLYKCDYRYVHHDSRDHRGIDVALLYNSARLRVIGQRRIPIVTPRGDTLATRDILYVCLEELCDEPQHWHILVNHHPSKVGSSTKSSPQGKSTSREIAMQTLAGVVDSLHRAGVTDNIVAMGDFNDTPDAGAFSLVEGSLVNLGIKLSGGNSGKSSTEGMPAVGSIRYNGRWELIDNFLVSPDVAAKKKMTVIRPPFLLERDRKHPGDKPFRTYSGPRYLGGVSDHLPVILD